MTSLSSMVQDGNGDKRDRTDISRRLKLPCGSECRTVVRRRNIEGVHGKSDQAVMAD